MDNYNDTISHYQSLEIKLRVRRARRGVERARDDRVHIQYYYGKGSPCKDDFSD